MPMDRHRKLLVAVYAGGAAALAPWIVFLWVVEPARGLAHDVVWLSAGLVAALTAAAAVTGVLCATGSRLLPVAAGFTGWLAFATLWFHVTSPLGHQSVPATVRSIVILLVPLGLLAWLVIAEPRDGDGTTVPGRRLMAAAYGVSALLLLAGAFRLASVAPSTAVVHHVRLLWTGLDTFELLALAATAWCIHTRSRVVVLASTFTAALLTADAWTNVASSTDAARTAALAMAVIEISLAALSLWVAVSSSGSTDRQAGSSTARGLRLVRGTVRPKAVVHDGKELTGPVVVCSCVTDRIGHSSQQNHHVLDGDVAPHGAGSLSTAQQLSQGIGERPDDRRTGELEVDPVVGQGFDEVALLCAFDPQAFDEGGKGGARIRIVLQDPGLLDQLADPIEDNRLE